MVVLAGGPHLAGRRAILEDVAQRAMKGLHPTKAQSIVLVELDTKLVQELGGDPRRDTHPLMPSWERVPLGSSVRQALLAGDSDAFLERVLHAAAKRVPWSAQEDDEPQSKER
ncbi:hypothetical protein QEG98_42015 (plasmid) [Myxococcus sp. MxC21-1]|uniref:hypothetical protein n=1 Tax=Myxococcus sp. MxC21-1 TaxID=3041439 RepID=UPI00292F85DA|nr:hypothetical protein [Myxococcus sp. MxC21-1]WNZ66245.1 hypothetical protein QEG98_42015 [Myxococcus sp. MxC21-1]